MSEESDQPSNREYDKFRIDGAIDNPHTEEEVTVGVTIDDVVSVELPAEDVLYEKDTQLTQTCLLQDINLNLKLILRHFEEITNQEITEEDIEDN